MGLFKTFCCIKCGKTYEGILNVCSCGGRAAPVSGIQACLDSGRPPGYAGGSNKPYSARSYDKCLKRNFKTMGITNCTHKDGKPICTFANKVDPQRASYPSWAGQQAPIKSYGSFQAMARDGVAVPPMRIEGQPFTLPDVHPEVQMGARVGQFPRELAQRTVIEYRDKTKYE